MKGKGIAHGSNIVRVPSLSGEREQYHRQKERIEANTLTELARKAERVTYSLLAEETFHTFTEYRAVGASTKSPTGKRTAI